MSRKQEQSNSDTHLLYLGKGAVYGLVFFLSGMYFLSGKESGASVMGESTAMPIIAMISNDFQTGIEIAGALFREKAHLFNGLDSLLQLNGFISESTNIQDLFKQNFDGNSSPRYWDRKEVERKLKKKLSRNKFKSAQRFLDYVDEYRALASEEMAWSRIPASVKLAQGLLEGNAGASKLAKKAKNHFGIKCRKYKNYKADGKIDQNDFYHHQLAYDCLQKADDHEWDRFEMYSSDERSYYRHSLLLVESERYNWMLDRFMIGELYPVSESWFGVSTVPYYAAWAIGLKKSGYATSKTYAQKIAYIIDTYELWRIDYDVIEVLS